MKDSASLDLGEFIKYLELVTLCKNGSKQQKLDPVFSSSPKWIH